MASSVRIYESEQAARDVSSKLEEAGFRKQRAFLASDLAGREEAAIKAAVEEEIVDGGYAAACVRCLQQGRSLVAVNAPFGSGTLALKLLGSTESGDPQLLPALPARDPAPFSDLLGIPVLSTFVPMTELKESDWALTGGFGLLGGSAAPLSSMFGMKTVMPVRAGSRGNPGTPMKKANPAPLSSMTGMPTVLAPKKDWQTSFGFQMLMQNPAPLSSLLGMATLTNRQ